MCNSTAQGCGTPCGNVHAMTSRNANAACAASSAAWSSCQRSAVDSSHERRTQARQSAMRPCVERTSVSAATASRKPLPGPVINPAASPPWPKCWRQRSAASLGSEATSVSSTSTTRTSKTNGVGTPLKKDRPPGSRLACKCTPKAALKSRSRPGSFRATTSSAEPRAASRTARTDMSACSSKSRTRVRSAPAAIDGVVES
mmetsp:Transcript_83270/g.220886  ORF Transcript_83270/g.220886 Transcript_83270/m.220886 type:complete len:201 (+) Transcript_83270:1088-1690(+)